VLGTWCVVYGGWSETGKFPWGAAVQASFQRKGVGDDGRLLLQHQVGGGGRAAGGRRQQDEEGDRMQGAVGRSMQVGRTCVQLEGV
jgi:hypothetical protein